MNFVIKSKKKAKKKLVKKNTIKKAKKKLVKKNTIKKAKKIKRNKFSKKYNKKKNKGGVGETSQQDYPVPGRMLSVHELREKVKADNAMRAILLESIKNGGPLRNLTDGEFKTATIKWLDEQKNEHAKLANSITYSSRR